MIDRQGLCLVGSDLSQCDLVLKKSPSPGETYSPVDPDGSFKLKCTSSVMLYYKQLRITSQAKIAKLHCRIKLCANYKIIKIRLRKYNLKSFFYFVQDMHYYDTKQGYNTLMIYYSEVNSLHGCNWTDGIQSFLHEEGDIPQDVNVL